MGNFLPALVRATQTLHTIAGKFVGNAIVHDSKDHNNLSSGSIVAVIFVVLI